MSAADGPSVPRPLASANSKSDMHCDAEAYGGYMKHEASNAQTFRSASIGTLRVDVVVLPHPITIRVSSARRTSLRLYDFDFPVDRRVRSGPRWEDDVV